MNDLESRLRRDLPAVADAILAEDEPDGPFARRVHDIGRQARSRLAAPPTMRTSRVAPITAVAASLIVVAGVVAIAAFGLRTPQPEEPSAANEPVERIPPAAPEQAGQVWFTTIADLLPDEFTLLGLGQSDASYVHFEAVDPATTRTLSINISRGPEAPDPSGAIPIAEARTTDWANADPIDINVSLLDGRQISIGCSVNALDEPDCPPINDTTIKPEVLGQLAVSLADQLAVDDLPPPTVSLDHVPLDRITTAVASVLDVDEQYSVSSPPFAYSFAAYGDSDGTTEVHVRTVSGLMPTRVDQPTEGEIELPERRINWATLADGTVWTVTTSLDLQADTGQRILAAGESVPDSALQTVTLPPAPAPAPAPAPPTAEPGPDGALLLPNGTGMNAERLERGALAGDTPISWYATPTAQPETGTYLRVVAVEVVPFNSEVPADDVTGCAIDGETPGSPSTLEDGTPTCLRDRDPSDPTGVIQLNVDQFDVTIAGSATDDQLVTAAENLEPAATLDGLGINPAGLPPGVEFIGTSLFVSDFATTQTSQAGADDMILASFVDDESNLIFYLATRSVSPALDTYRLGFGSITDTTVRGEPGFIRTLNDQPNYLGLVWQENGFTYQVGSQGLTQDDLLSIVEQFEPATQPAWETALTAIPDVDQTEEQAVTTTTLIDE